MSQTDTTRSCVTAGWQGQRSSTQSAAKTFSIPLAYPLPPHLTSIASTEQQTSLFVEFFTHTIISSDSQPAWLQLLRAAPEQATPNDSKEMSADQNCQPAHISAPHVAAVPPCVAVEADTELASSQASPESLAPLHHPSCSSMQTTDNLTTHLSPWLYPSQGPQVPLELPESSVIAPEAAAALESSSAAAADALHSILVQVAMTRSEDTTTFVQKALKDPAIMQVLLYCCPGVSKTSVEIGQSGSGSFGRVG